MEHNDSRLNRIEEEVHRLTIAHARNRWLFISLAALQVVVLVVFVVLVNRRASEIDFLLAKLSTQTVTLSSTSPTYPVTSPIVDDPIEEFVETKMQPGSAAFAVPDAIPLGKTVEARLDIGPLSVPPEKLLAELQELMARSTVGKAGPAKLASQMRAKLKCNRECTIAAIDPEDQAVSFKERRMWRWNLTPLEEGEMRVSVLLTAPLIVEAGRKETEYRVTGFDADVTVSVTTPGRIAASLRFLKDNWTALGSVGGGLVAIWAWMRRKPKPQPTPPEEPSGKD